MAAPKAPYLGKTGKVDLDAEVFGEEFHMALVHETVRAELNARRRGTASTRTRGEVAMTTAKAFRQKGTGRARAGALSTPQRTGGGVAFGPKPRGYKVKVNRKARRRALRAALTIHAERGSIAVVDPAGFDAPSTKSAAEGLAGFGEGHALVVLAREGEESCVKSFRNLTGVDVLPSDNVAVADIVRAARLVVSPSALERLTEIAKPPTASSHRERQEEATA
jgi:large subunit ribosomal protein L4